MAANGSSGTRDPVASWSGLLGHCPTPAGQLGPSVWSSRGTWPTYWLKRLHQSEVQLGYDVISFDCKPWLPNPIPSATAALATASGIAFEPLPPAATPTIPTINCFF